jgi:hypothetical protein
VQQQSPTQISLSNQSAVYEKFHDHEKLTITEVTERLNDNAEPSDKLSDRTIRRAIEQLTKNGHLKTYGKRNNATLYGRLSASYTEPDQKLINFGGDLMTVGEFLHRIVDVGETPLQTKKYPVTSKRAEHDIRRRLAFVVWSAGNVGMNAQLQVIMKDLHTFLKEYEHVVNLLKNFLDSPLWYEQYRDKIGLAVREMQEKEPELFELTTQYIASEK